MVVGEVISRLWEVDKINTASLGNMVAQLHVHVIGRRHGDPAWPGPVWGRGEAQPLRACRTVHFGGDAAQRARLFMKALIQRVSSASVSVAGDVIGAVDQGLLVFVGIEKGDTVAQAERMAARLLSYRVFSDDADKMNLSVSDVGGGLLLISQFTLAADTNTGKRASFSSAAPPGGG
jgi:D-tyrosyl-tRNA(Tyr) deacylase